ncbi:MAG: hypothetical protein GY754_38460 [bacterium]|nr:hypothetical protein [bacterium]
MKRIFFSSVVSMVLLCLFVFSGCEEALTSNDGTESGESGFSFSDLYSRIKTLEDENKRLNEVIGSITGGSGISIGDLASQVGNLETDLGSLNTRVGNFTVNEEQTVASRIENLEDDMGDGSSGVLYKVNYLHDTLFAGVSRLTDPYTQKSTIRFSGINVQIVSGSGSTDGTVNGLGNLIVGYNETRSLESNKSGSHNIIVGRWHNYSSYGGLVVGNYNTISGTYSSVCGGTENTASGQDSSVSGGAYNTASGYWSSVSGGRDNIASWGADSVSGGASNTASGNCSAVSGGYENLANWFFSSVSGGRKNTAGRIDLSSPDGGDSSSVGGGYGNNAVADYQFLP